MASTVHDVICSLVPGMAEIFIALWLAWALIAPVVAGPIPQPMPPHDCPNPSVRHSVGGDLKTRAITYDRCAQSIPKAWK